MFMNGAFFVALPLGALLFAGGFLLARRVSSRKGKIALLLSLLLCLPGASFIAYYTHLFGEPVWYIEFRSINNIEILSGCWGLPMGLLVGWNNRRMLTASLLALALISLPFIKPILTPVDVAGQLHDEWSDGVCLQTTSATCGPASLATILAGYGMHCSERAIACRSYSSMGGTENWYLIRYARQQGFQVHCRHERELARIPMPAIIGIGTAHYGHFITLLGVEQGRYSIGDPLIGRMSLSRQEFDEKYRLSGFVMQVTR